MVKTSKKILVVEDDPDLNKAFSIILDKAGYKVSAAFNGQEALEILDKQVPDLILLDLLMPVMSGEQFLKEYSQLGHDAPVIVFTNLDAQNDIDEVQKLGATRYILKAWASPKDLVKVVKETLNGNS